MSHGSGGGAAMVATGEGDERAVAAPKASDIEKSGALLLLWPLHTVSLNPRDSSGGAFVFRARARPK